MPLLLTAASRSGPAQELLYGPILKLRPVGRGRAGSALKAARRAGVVAVDHNTAGHPMTRREQGPHHEGLLSCFLKVRTDIRAGG